MGFPAETLDVYLAKVCHSLNRTFWITGSAWIIGSAGPIALSCWHRCKLTGLHGALLLRPSGEQEVASFCSSGHRAKHWRISRGSGGDFYLQCCSINGNGYGNGGWFNANKLRLFFKTLSGEVE